MDVFDRIGAMPVVAEMLPEVPHVGSAAAGDPDVGAVSPYTFARSLLVGAIAQLLVAASTARKAEHRRLGTHILLLRPALVATAKAARVSEAPDRRERVQRTAVLFAEDRRQGARAMNKAVGQGAAAFGAVAEAFVSSQAAALSTIDGLTSAERKAPGDETMILELGAGIDRYQGTQTARSDVQILWSAASGLAHGERWYAALTGGRRAEVAEVLTERSLDVVCSGINVTNLQLITLATAPEFLTALPARES